MRASLVYRWMISCMLSRVGAGRGGGLSASGKLARSSGSGGGYSASGVWGRAGGSVCDGFA